MAHTVTAVVSRFMDLPQWYSVKVGGESVGPVALRDVRAAAQDLVGDPDTVIEVEFPAPYGELLDQVRTSAAEAERATAAAQAAKLRLIDAVIAEGESDATAGVVLGVSRQRVQQLLAARAARGQPRP